MEINGLKHSLLSYTLYVREMGMFKVLTARFEGLSPPPDMQIFLEDKVPLNSPRNVDKVDCEKTSKVENA